MDWLSFTLGLLVFPVLAGCVAAYQALRKLLRGHWDERRAAGAATLEFAPRLLGEIRHPLGPAEESPEASRANV